MSYTNGVMIPLQGPCCSRDCNTLLVTPYLLKKWSVSAEGEGWMVNCSSMLGLVYYRGSFEKMMTFKIGVWLRIEASHCDCF